MDDDTHPLSCVGCSCQHARMDMEHHIIRFVAVPRHLGGTACSWAVLASSVQEHTRGCGRWSTASYGWLITMVYTSHIQAHPACKLPCTDSHTQQSYVQQKLHHTSSMVHSLWSLSTSDLLGHVCWPGSTRSRLPSAHARTPG